ncbi:MULTISPECIES: fluoride efflux transporter CrcB [unclassified Phycicoccus]|uniref:fluoride efflux transporter CrcB n=1 Tax=unclassified Phycicoccus TaxID=2637926 RepID=UPI000AF24B77|nr:MULTISPECIES: fluoride efflux transporter CrcB [unclassified Phycicoccus]
MNPARTAPTPTLLAVVAAGGALGSLGRYAAGLALPHVTGDFPWATFLVNVTGSFAMGLLVAWVLSMTDPHPALRPFLGVGVLGGWTTFSSFALDVHAMGGAGRPGLALAYVLASFLLGLVAVGLGLGVGQRVLGDLR